MTDASRYLTTVAARIAAALTATTRPRAMLLIGSAAEGVSDYQSDLDFIAYYETVPAMDEIAAAHAALGVTDSTPLGEANADGRVESFTLAGIECQVGHVAIAGWERDLATVLDTHTPGTVTEKAISGLLAGQALGGADLIGAWQARAADYSAALAAANVAHHLRFFPIWSTLGYWQARDATIFYYQTLADTCLNLLGVLAALNRVYFSSFQFKRLRAFAAKLDHAPANLAPRLDALFTVPPAVAGPALRDLMGETIGLVEIHLPAADTAGARRRLTETRPPWTPVGDRSGASARP